MKKKMSLKDLSCKAYKDMENRFPLYVSLSFIVILSITLFLMQNEVFSSNLIDIINQIYAKIVASQTTSFSFQPYLMNIFLAFLKWFIEVFIIVLLIVSLIPYLLSRNKNIDYQKSIFSLLFSILVGSLVALLSFVGFKMSFFSISILVIFIFSFLTIFHQLKNNFKKFLVHLKNIIPLILFWEIFYFLGIILHFTLSILLLYILKRNPYSVFGIILDSILFIFYIFLLHGLLNSSILSQRKFSFFKKIKHSLFSKRSLQLTGLGIVSILLLNIIIWILSFANFFYILSKIVFVVFFSLGIVYYIKLGLYLHEVKS